MSMAFAGIGPFIAAQRFVTCGTRAMVVCTQVGKSSQEHHCEHHRLEQRSGAEFAYYHNRCCAT